jgi:RNA polymerase sigma-70 factor (ECF subfamily)
MTPIPDLLARARNGDDAARDELFARCRSYVGIVARAQIEGRLRAKVDASDLVQQTLLEAHRGLTNFRGGTEEEWLGWLRQILAHNATDFIRRYRTTGKRQLAREVPLHVSPPGASGSFFRDPADPGETPSQLLLQHERELEVAEAIERLPEDYREVVMLRNLQRLPFSEVAERMGRSRPAVQMLWLRALRQLEGMLCGGEEYRMSNTEG